MNIPEAAFPYVFTISDGNFDPLKGKVLKGESQVYVGLGMSIRDYFAAAALQGMMCNGFQPIKFYSGAYSEQKTYEWAEAAYAIADYMITKRKEK